MKRQLLLIGAISDSGAAHRAGVRAISRVCLAARLRIPDTSMAKFVRHHGVPQSGRAPLPRFTTIWNE